jgi:hypothetical protein
MQDFRHICVEITGLVGVYMEFATEKRIEDVTQRCKDGGKVGLGGFIGGQRLFFGWFGGRHDRSSIADFIYAPKEKGGAEFSSLLDSTLISISVVIAIRQQLQVLDRING